MTIRSEIEALRSMTVGRLRERYAEVFGEPSLSYNKQFLFRRVAWWIQALAEGGLSERARQRALEIANDADLRVPPPKDAIACGGPPAANRATLQALLRLSTNQPCIHTQLTDVSDLSAFPPERDFDTVICRYAVEKTADEAGALRNIHAVLRDGGTAVVMVPQGSGLYSSIDEAAGHVRRYSADGLVAACRAAGLEPRTIIPFNRLSSPLWMWDGKIGKRRNVGIGRLKLYNAVVRLIRRFDHLLPFPPLSLIGVFEKAPVRSESRASGRTPYTGESAATHPVG